MSNSMSNSEKNFIEKVILKHIKTNKITMKEKSYAFDFYYEKVQNEKNEHCRSYYIKILGLLNQLQDILLS